jgi:hypothetical protein
MSSGGSRKEKWDKIYIEAPMSEASSIFYSRFGHAPSRVTCTCCGEDYSVSESDTLEEASAYHRNCPYYQSPDKKEGGYFESGEEIPEGWKVSRFHHGEYVPLEKYVHQDHVLVIRADEINDDERNTDVPLEGYVWM